MKDDELGRFFNVDERREEARLNLGAEIYIETVSQEPGEKNPSVVLKCESVDLSANGLQVLVYEALVVGAIHTLLIEFDAHEKPFKLIAEVRWIKPHAQGYLIGLSLYDSEGTEIIDWKFMMAKSLN
ncbi:MAG: hypothetical protein ACI84K_000764 [Pseudohongiellaceae bacterium]